MEKKLLDALAEMEGAKFESLTQALQEYSGREIFDSWLRYEGISGYGEKILDAIYALNLGEIKECMVKPRSYVDESEGYKAHFAGMTSEEIYADLRE